MLSESFCATGPMCTANPISSSSRPFVPGGRSPPSLPIVIMCRNYTEAGKYNILNTLCSRIDHLSEDQIIAQFARMLMIPELAAVLTETGKFYSVRLGKGGYSGIWLEW